MRCPSRLRAIVPSAALLILAAVLLGFPAVLHAEQAAGKAEFAKGFPADPSFFPIGVWLQSPRNAASYSAMGVNTFIGTWKPPTKEELDELDRNGIFLIVEQTPQALALGDSRVIRAWLHIDEPDNAQPNGRGGYGDCIAPEEVVRRYQDIRAADATRPVLLNFGQAVANPRWFGRGDKCGRIAPEAYYTPASRGADIVSFDIYPAAEERQTHVMGKLELVGQGVANLKRWAKPGQPVWSAIETTHINHPLRRPMPAEIRSEVWMALIHGASGIFYFAHEWKPNFREDAVFRYPDNVQEITRVNAQIKALAPVLNSPSLADRVRVEAPVAIATLVKRHADADYVFAVNTTSKAAKAKLALTGVPGPQAVVLGEDRLIRIEGGAISDDFAPYGVRLYKIPPAN